MKANLFFIVLAVVFMIFYFLFLYKLEQRSHLPAVDSEYKKEKNQPI